MPRPRKLGREVPQQCVPLRYILLDPTMHVSPMYADSEDALEISPCLGKRAAVKIHPQGCCDCYLWLPHSWQLPVVEKLMATTPASVKLPPLPDAVSDHFHRSTPLTRIPPGRSFIGQSPVWGMGGTAGFDARNIDLSGPSVLPTPGGSTLTVGRGPTSLSPGEGCETRNSRPGMCAAIAQAAQGRDLGHFHFTTTRSRVASSFSTVPCCSGAKTMGLNPSKWPRKSLAITNVLVNS